MSALMAASGNQGEGETERYIDSDIWYACAEGTVQMPPLQTKVFYFPQGHAEHCCSPVYFQNHQTFHPYTLCTITSIKLMADRTTDQVYAKINLSPCDVDDELDGVTTPQIDRLPSCSKTLTQSDANNGGGFSVPRSCADKIFPPLDFNVEPPVQTLTAKDVHGKVWSFRHIYRGTPRRHLLTTGWSPFVNAKMLVAGDSVVFFKSVRDELYVGIRRGNTTPGDVNVTPESVVEAASLAAKGQPFEVIYFPRADTSEFCVKASLVKAAMQQVVWKVGKRFKMAFGTDDFDQLNWFRGAITDIQPIDPICWSFSPWKLLEVAWDEKESLKNVKRVSPWQLELEIDEKEVHLLPPTKKMRFPPHPYLSLCGQPKMLTSSLDLNNLSCSTTHDVCLTTLGVPPVAVENSDNVSTILNEISMTTRPFMLFGQLILTEEQVSQLKDTSTSGDT